MLGCFIIISVFKLRNLAGNDFFKGVWCEEDPRAAFRRWDKKKVIFLTKIVARDKIQLKIQDHWALSIQEKNPV